MNDKNERLLMCADDPKTIAADGRYLGKFWFTVGGEIKLNESYQQIAYREIYEEMGLEKDEIELGSNSKNLKISENTRVKYFFLIFAKTCL